MTNPANNPDTPRADDAFIADCLRYLDGQLHGEALTGFRLKLDENANCRAVFVELAVQHEMVADVLDAHHAEHVIDNVLRAGGDAPAVTTSDAGLLSLLSKCDEEVLERSRQDEKPISVRELVSLAGYVVSRSVTQRPALYGSVAAAFILGIGLYLFVAFGPGSSSPTTPQAPRIAEKDSTPAARLTGQHHAVWEDASLVTGQSLRTGQTLRLVEGFAQITTNDGAVAILQAPCAFELLGPNALKLNAGQLLAKCLTPRSKGFTVHTQYATIIDHGTVFGVTHQGETRATVFEGSVTIEPAEKDKRDANRAPVMLGKGDGARIDHQAEIQKSDQPITDRYVRDWSALDQPQLTGRIRFEPALPPSFALNACESNVILMFHEQSNVVPGEGVRVTMTKPGKYIDFPEGGPVINAAMPVDSYLVHYDFKSGGDPTSSRKATIRFDRPIVGVIANETALLATDALFGANGVTYKMVIEGKDQIGRGLERALNRPADIVQISNDRRTLTIEFYGALAIDQVRVLVQASELTDQ